MQHSKGKPNNKKTTNRQQQFGKKRAQCLADLQIPPSNKLEKLKGNFKEFYSIRINNQWRLIFKWHNSNTSNVEIIDYR